MTLEVFIIDDIDLHIRNVSHKPQAPAQLSSEITLGTQGRTGRLKIDQPGRLILLQCPHLTVVEYR